MIAAWTMNKENSCSSVGTAILAEKSTSYSPSDDNVQCHWQGAVKRREFLKGISLAGATATAGALIGKQLSAKTARHEGKNILYARDKTLLVAAEQDVNSLIQGTVSFYA